MYHQVISILIHHGTSSKLCVKKEVFGRMDKSRMLILFSIFSIWWLSILSDFNAHAFQNVSWNATETNKRFQYSFRLTHERKFQTIQPTTLSTGIPSKSIATRAPSVKPTIGTTIKPTEIPSKSVVTKYPSPKPTQCPSNVPSKGKSSTPPSILPTRVTVIPSPKSRKYFHLLHDDDSGHAFGSKKYTLLPSITPSILPSTRYPSAVPSKYPIIPSQQPRERSGQISPSPTTSQSSSPPSFNPSHKPTVHPLAQYSIYNVSYHPRNPVLTGTVNLYNIYFGKTYKLSSSTASTKSLVDYFSSNVGNSSWYKTVSSDYYQVNADNTTTNAANNLTFIKSINVNSGLTATNNPVYLNNSIIIGVIVNAFNTLRLPIDTNGVYAVIFRGDFTFNEPGLGGWLNGWCGYHSSFILYDQRVIKFLVVGDINSAPDHNQLAFCAQFTNGMYSVNGNAGADALINIYAHELVETITNWDNAWYTDYPFEGGVEIADRCNFDFGVDVSQVNWNIQVGEKKFLVQNIWRPGHGCVHSCC